MSSLQELDTETWGERLKRARERSGITLIDAARRVSSVLPSTPATLNRLEKLAEPPENWERRVRAYLVLLVYGYRPAAFGLTAEETLPELWRVSERELIKRLRRDLGCVTGAETWVEEAA